MLFRLLKWSLKFGLQQCIFFANYTRIYTRVCVCVYIYKSSITFPRPLFCVTWPLLSLLNSVMSYFCLDYTAAAVIVRMCLEGLLDVTPCGMVDCVTAFHYNS